MEGRFCVLEGSASHQKKKTKRKKLRLWQDPSHPYFQVLQVFTAWDPGCILQAEVMEGIEVEQEIHPCQARKGIGLSGRKASSSASGRQDQPCQGHLDWRILEDIYSCVRER